MEIAKILLEISQIAANVAIVVFIIKAFDKRGPFECIHEKSGYQPIVKGNPNPPAGGSGVSDSNK